MGAIRIIAENTAVGGPIKADAKTEAFFAAEEISANLLITACRVFPAGVVAMHEKCNVLLLLVRCVRDIWKLVGRRNQPILEFVVRDLPPICEDIERLLI